MKRILSILLVSALFACAAFASAEETAPAVRETIEIKTGKAWRIEIYDFTSVNGIHRKPIVFQIKSATDLKTGEKSYCARLTYSSSRGDITVDLSAAEIRDSLLTLHYLDEQFGGLRKYTNVSYRTNGGFRLGLEYEGEKKPADVNVYLYLDSNNAAYVPLSRVGELVTAFEATAEELARVSGQAQ